MLDINYMNIARVQAEEKAYEQMLRRQQEIDEALEEEHRLYEMWVDGGMVEPRDRME